MTILSFHPVETFPRHDDHGGGNAFSANRRISSMHTDLMGTILNPDPSAGLYIYIYKDSQMQREQEKTKLRVRERERERKTNPF